MGANSVAGHEFDARHEFGQIVRGAALPADGTAVDVLQDGCDNRFFMRVKKAVHCHHYPVARPATATAHSRTAQDRYRTPPGPPFESLHPWRGCRRARPALRGAFAVRTQWRRRMGASSLPRKTAPAVSGIAKKCPASPSPHYRGTARGVPTYSFAHASIDAHTPYRRASPLRTGADGCGSMPRPVPGTDRCRSRPDEPHQSASARRFAVSIRVMSVVTRRASHARHNARNVCNSLPCLRENQGIRQLASTKINRLGRTGSFMDSVPPFCAFGRAWQPQPGSASILPASMAHCGLVAFTTRSRVTVFLEIGY